MKLARTTSDSLVTDRFKQSATSGYTLVTCHCVPAGRMRWRRSRGIGTSMISSLGTDRFKRSVLMAGELVHHSPLPAVLTQEVEAIA